MITETTKQLLDIPDSFVDDLGGITLSSFWPVFSAALKSYDGPVVEIGADRGFVTKQFADACFQQDRLFYSVDPSPAEGVDDIPGVKHIRKTSKNFFAEMRIPAGIWIVDGDHNYNTVEMELAQISKTVGDGDAIIFLHDIGWPSGRRDFWYAASEAPSTASLAKDGFSVSLDDSGPVPVVDGIGLGPVQAFTPHEGGKKNGVMTAVEDFLGTNEGTSWELHWTPIFFGFGFLVKKNSPNSQQLITFFDHFEQVRPVLSALEANRLRLLQTLNNKWIESARKDDLIWQLEQQPKTLLQFIKRAIKRQFSVILGAKP